MGYRTPAEFAAAVQGEEGRGKEVQSRDLEIPAGFPLAHRPGDGDSSLSREIPKQESRLGSEANIV